MYEITIMCFTPSELQIQFCGINCIKADCILNIKPLGKGGSGGGTFHLHFTVGHFVGDQVNMTTI